MGLIMIGVIASLVSIQRELGGVFWCIAIATAVSMISACLFVLIAYWWSTRDIRHTPIRHMQISESLDPSEVKTDSPPEQGPQQ